MSTTTTTRSARNGAGRREMTGPTPIDACVTRGWVKPTSLGWAILVLAVLVWYLSLVYDQLVLAAMAAMLTLTWIVSLVVTIMQYRNPAGTLGPTAPTLTTQFEKIDSSGDVTARYKDAVPLERGWYRRAPTVMQWKDPLALFALRRPFAETGAVAIMPETDAEDKGRSLAELIARRTGVDEATGIVREYQPGDPLRLIAWKHAASHGRLMTRETSSAASARTDIILVVDPTGRAVGEDELTAQACLVRDWTRTAPQSANITVTDGIREATNTNAISWLLATMQNPEAPPAPPAKRRRGLARLLQRRRNKGTKDLSAWGAENRAAFVRQVSLRTGREAQVVLVTQDAQSPFANRLRSLFGAAFHTVTPPDASGAHYTVAGRDAGTAPEAWRRVPQPPAPFTAPPALLETTPPRSTLAIIKGRLAAEGAPSFWSFWTLETSEWSSERTQQEGVVTITTKHGMWIDGTILTKHPLEPLRSQAPSDRVAAFASSAAMLACSAMFIVGMSHLFTVEGAWWPLMAALFLVAASLLPVLRLWWGEGRWRVAAILGIVLAGMALLAARVYSYTGVAPWDSVAAANYLGANPIILSRGSMSMGTLDGWLALLTPFVLTVFESERGMIEMAFQLAPYTVDPSIDVTIMLMTIIVGLVVCLGAYWEETRAQLAVLPLLSFGLSAVRGGTAIPFWQVVLAVTVSVALLWCSNIGAVRPVPGASLVAGITAVSLALSPAVLNVSYRVDLPGRRGGLFSSSTVNPMVDLTQSLRHGNSNAVALIYRGDRPLYLRMASLGKFDGDTWSFDDATVQQGRFYGTGGSMGPTDGTSYAAYAWRRNLYLPPFTLYWYTQYTLNESGLATIDADALHDQWVSADVQIHTLQSRLLPVIGPYVSNITSGEQWYTNSDDTVFSENSTTSNRLGYTTRGQYMTPISSDDGFAQIDALASVHDQLVEFAEQNASAEEDAEGSDENGDDTQSSVLDQVETSCSLMGNQKWREWITCGAENVGEPQAAALVDDMLDSLDDREDAIRAAYLSLSGDVPASVTGFVSDAQAAGVPTGGASRDDQIAAMKYIVDYFTDPANGFTYSLDAPDDGGHSNMEELDAFLERRSGYCQHYATAAAILGRAMGVPTRIVLGFGEPAAAMAGENGTLFADTMQNLHAWTEAYITDVGWVPIDVTPASDDETGTFDASMLSSDFWDFDFTGSGQLMDFSDPMSSGLELLPYAEYRSWNYNRGGTGGTGGTLSISDETRDAILRTIGITVGVVLLALLLVPKLIRLGRRRRRLRAIGRAEDAGGGLDEETRDEAWRCAWNEIRDTACDAGVAWDIGDTDDQIARAAADACRRRAALKAADDGSTGTAGSTGVDGEEAAEWDPDSILAVCDAATAVQFGGPVPRPAGLAETVSCVNAVLRPAGLRRRIWPRSVLHGSARGAEPEEAPASEGSGAPGAAPAPAVA